MSDHNSIHCLLILDIGMWVLLAVLLRSTHCHSRSKYWIPVMLIWILCWQRLGSGGDGGTICTLLAEKPRRRYITDLTGKSGRKGASQNHKHCWVVVISSSSMVVHKNYEHIKMSNKSYKIASTVRTPEESRVECVLLMFALLSYEERS